MTTEINLPRHVALYRDICRHTECDTRRLAYADVLDEIGGERVECPRCVRGWDKSECKVCGNTPDEDGCIEHGRGCYTQSEDGGGYELASPCPRDPECDGTVPSTDNRDRAEFIRLQCELARLLGKWPGTETFTDEGIRANQLLAAHPEWRKCPCPACEGTNRTFDACPCGGSGDLFHPFGDGAKPRTVHFARGFPDSVECTAADVWREEDVPCPHCEDAPTCPETNVVECSRCDCTGVIDTRTVPTEWAKAVVRVSPVTRFVVTDFVPAGSARHGGWWRWYAGEARDEVPQVVFDLLVGEYPSDWRGAALVPYWRSEAAARDALAVALAKWVRAAAYPVAPGG